jgi:hypothetical protein
LKDAPLVVVHEGEKAADAATSIGFTATTSAGGSKAAKQTDWTPLAGKKAWLFRDNDKPGGAYGADVVGILATLTPPPEIKVIDLPGLPEGGDMVDFVEANSQADDLKSLIEDMAAKVTAEGAPPPDPQRYEFIDSAAFARGDYRHDWRVKNVMVRDEPVLVAGRSKTLKTNIVIDLFVSLATATPFLGTFDVPRKIRVAVVSGESGKRTLQETAKRVCRSKGFDLADVGPGLNWCFSLPCLSDLDDMAKFVDPLLDTGAEVVALDPAYLMLGDVNAANMFEVGPVLRNVGELLVRRGVQPTIVHHANRRIDKREGEAPRPMELADIAYSGFDQFARQFLLLSRREVYGHDGKHALWLVTGGSAGHNGLYGLDVNEGTLAEDFTGRVWEPAVANINDLNEQRQTRKTEGKARQKKEDEALVLQSIDSLVNCGKAPTVNRIREHNNLSDDRAKSALGRLLDEGILTVSSEKVGIGSNAKRDSDVYRRKGPSGLFGGPSGPSGTPDGH